MALAPLRHPPFGRLLTSYTVNQLGDYVGVIALALLVYAETKDPLAVSALFIAAQFAPALFAPWVTARVDQTDLRRALPAIYMAEAAIFAALALLAHEFLLTGVLALSFVDGVLMLTARGLTRGAINATLEPVGLLREGNGLINVGFAVAGVGGSALGGVLAGTLGISAALLIDAASFVLVAVLLATARGLPAPSAERTRMFQRLRESLRFARNHPTVRTLLAGETVAVILFALVVPVEVLYARETLGTDEAGYGLLLAAWGAGVVLGSMVYLRSVKRSTRTLIVLSTAAIGVAYLGMGLVDELQLACGLAVLGGIGNGIQWVAVMTAVQEATPGDLQARIAGLLESMTSGVTGLGFLAGGALTALTSPPTAFVVAGIGVLTLAILGPFGLRGIGQHARTGTTSEMAPVPAAPPAP